MIEIAILITLLAVSYKSWKSLKENSEIFKEFNLPRILQALVFIYPVGPLLLFFSVLFPPIILYPIVAACFIPQLVIARQQTNILSLSGTDRVIKAKEALSLTSLGAIIGLIHLSFVLIMVYAISSVATSNHY